MPETLTLEREFVMCNACLDIANGTAHPMAHGDWVYATDCRVLIRMRRDQYNPPSSEPVGELDARRARMYEHILADIPTEGFTPIPRESFEDVAHECGVCDGCNRPPDDRIDEDGDCVRCRGVGRVISESTEVVVGVRINARYSQMIRPLPNLAVKQRSSDLLWFRFDGGEGCLAGVRQVRP